MQDINFYDGYDFATLRLRARNIDVETTVRRGRGRGAAVVALNYNITNLATDAGECRVLYILHLAQHN